MLQASVEAEWNYAANLTEENRIAQVMTLLTRSSAVIGALC